MQLKDYLTGEMESVQRMLGLALEDLDDEVANWQPGGTANSIASILAHVTDTQDRSINVRLLGGETVFESGGWATKTGIPTDPEKIWDTTWRLNLDTFGEYKAALAESTGRFMDALQESDLDREIEYSHWPRPAAWLLRNIVFHHSLYHTGEIFTLKGLKGLKGLPF